MEGQAALAEGRYLKHYGYSFWDHTVEKYNLHRRGDLDGDGKHLGNGVGLQLVDCRALAEQAEGPKP